MVVTTAKWRITNIQKNQTIICAFEDIEKNINELHWKDYKLHIEPIDSFIESTDTNQVKPKKGLLLENGD